MRLPTSHLLLPTLLAGALLLNACAPVSIPPTVQITATTVALASPTLPVPTETPTVLPSPTATPTITASPTPAPSPSPTLASNGDPARGTKLFATLPCTSCHDISHPFPGGAICPNLGNIAAEAARIVQSPDYHGRATDAAGYIRESIMNPNAYIVPGAQYRQADGQSVMPKNFGQILTPQQIDDLVAFLLAQTDGQLPTPAPNGGN
jgi:cytochrome c2